MIFCINCKTNELRIQKILKQLNYVIITTFFYQSTDDQVINMAIYHPSEAPLLLYNAIRAALLINHGLSGSKTKLNGTNSDLIFAVRHYTSTTIEFPTVSCIGLCELRKNRAWTRQFC